MDSNHKEEEIMDNQIALFIDFENIAIWAGENFYDLDLKQLMEYLQSRGPVVIKRAYGDWSKFSKYRDDLVDNSFDLIQMYSVRTGKNRADIRLALDAFETAIHRKHINQMAIVSGDSDFGELASKLREYGQYILGIGPRAITHPLLVKSCDEFIYLETILGVDSDSTDNTATAHESARKLLMGALEAFGKRGELPVDGAKLKQKMLSMDSTFNELNLGYKQFRSWLETNSDLVNLYFRGLVMYVAPNDFEVPEQPAVKEARKPSQESEVKPETSTSLSTHYSTLFAKIIAVDLEPRRDMLRAMYRELSDHPGKLTITMLTQRLQSQFEAKGTIYSRSAIQKFLQMAYLQQAYRFVGPISISSPMVLAEEMDTQTRFIQRVESHFPYAILQAGLSVHLEEIAMLLLADRSQTEYVQELLDDLEKRQLIRRTKEKYHLVGHSENPLSEDPHLRHILDEINRLEIPGGTEETAAAAKELAAAAMSKRTHDFSASAKDFLLACKIQWIAFERKDEDATLDDLRWYIASYASVKAGELAQVFGDFDNARSYYLAFFSLVQEESPLWDRMRGLINPMLSFYWKNLARELGADLEYSNSPVGVALQLATTDNLLLRTKWFESTQTLARINPGILQRVVNNVRLITTDPRSSSVAETIEQLLNDKGAQMLV
jgi:uncharacterized LabA/DUF88 family protein